MRWLFKILVPLFGIFTAYSAYATTSLSANSKSDDPLFVVVMGDSVSLGVWADSYAGNPGPYFYLSAAKAKIETTLIQIFTGFRTDNLAAFEKHSTMIDHLLWYISRPQYSALVGGEDYSISQRLERATGKDVELVDTSFLAGCYHLSAIHLERLRQFMKRHPGHKAPDFIFVNFSAMDFVFNSSIQRFERDLRVFYAQLTQEYPHTTIIANTLVDVASSMSSSLNEIAVPGTLISKPLTCNDSYKMIGFGSLIGIREGVTEEHLTKLHNKLNTMNSKLANEMAAINAHIYPYDRFKGKAIEVVPFQPPSGKWIDYLAADCIHPSIWGHEAYSELLWNAVRDHLEQR